jgi:uncharacterized protein YoaH (UPF0181 family)
MSLIAALLALALQNPPAPPPTPPGPAPKAPPQEAEEKDLTPEEALKILKECGKLMEEAETLLNDSSRGKALGSEKEAVERITKLLGTTPKSPEEEQKAILEKIEKLMGKSQKSQGESVEKLADVIKRAKAQGQGQGQGQPQQGPPQQQDQMQQPGQKPSQPSSPATSPYDPNRNGDPINKFRSKGDRTGRWGDLPPRIREAMLSSKRDLDDFPPEYQQLLKEYFKTLSGDDK